MFLRITKQKQLCSSPKEALETGNYQKGNASKAEKSFRAANQPPPTLISFHKSLPLSVQSGNWNVTALCPKTVLLLRLIKTKTAIGLNLP